VPTLGVLSVVASFLVILAAFLIAWVLRARRRALNARL
jgi:hypothetical protein